ncbi:MAG: alanine--glyoxylate aminotransferase family protein [Thermoanaerobaculia bacterium]|nr:MAG: alanine--glyoxylate aminotransferase family protein [Thermoanaerobaculia bacterium]
MSEAIRDFLAGPVHVLEEVRQAMLRPMVAHRSAEFRAVWAAISAHLPPVFRTRREALVATGSSTLFMEAALVSLTERDVLHLTNGAFSERWLAIGRALGRASDELAFPWGEAVDPQLVAAALRRRRYEAVTLVHNETSTGAVSPLEEIARVVRAESDALLLVDAVSSLGGDRIETDAWGLDFVFAGTQKGIAAPPGLAVAALSERAEERAARVARRGFYLDLLRYRDRQREGGPITTPAIPVVYALARQLERVADEGMEARWERHARLARRTAESAERIGLRYAVAAGARSRTVACLRAPEGTPAPELVARLARRGFVVAGGYGKWKLSTFRIGHMGEVRDSDLEPLLAVLEEEVHSCIAS